MSTAAESIANLTQAMTPALSPPPVGSLEHAVLTIRPLFDAIMYAAEYDELRGDPEELLRHFCERGWREGRNPNADFNTAAYLRTHADVAAHGINPFYHYLLNGRSEGRAVEPAIVLHDPAAHDGSSVRSTRFAIDTLQPPAPVVGAAPDSVVYDDPVERCVAEHFDRGYYLAANPDVRHAGIDPVAHYCQIGWTERRNPSASFDTAYYLSANADVAQHRMNPFWHYLVAGKEEGRAPRVPGGYRRQIVESAVDPDDITDGYTRPELTGVLSRTRLENLLRPALEASKGLVISVGHDRYINVTGGVQLFMADEQAQFGRQGMTYLNISPYIALLRLADPEETGLMLNLVLDGALIGVAARDDLEAVLRALPPGAEDRRLFLVHCLFGHNVHDLIAIHRASASSTNFFWLHDYSSICVGYNLLRNDLEFCDAPPPGSITCRVCVYGDRRAGHLQQIRTLFEAVPFHVVAPSAAALRIWRRHAGLPHVSAMVHEHCRLAPNPASVRPAAAGPARVAFIGNPRANKGWPIWLELVARCMPLDAYRFFHLGNPDTDRGIVGVTHVHAATSPDHPDAMIDALVQLDIDLVVVPSTWPETFSYVTSEAMAAAADVVCLASSGNVAEMVLRNRRGVVAPDEESLLEFFHSRRAATYVELARHQGTPRGALVREGTTATIAAAACG